MEKLFAVLFAATLLLSLCACGNEAAVQPTPVMVVNDAEYNITASRLQELTGLSLPLPEGAEDIAYNVITPSTAPMAEAEFTLNGQRWYLRAEATALTELSTENSDAWNISGLYYSWTQGEATVSYCKAFTHVCSEAGFIAWLDAAPGIVYNLCSSSGVTAEALTAAAEAVFVPLQGEVG